MKIGDILDFTADDLRVERNVKERYHIQYSLNEKIGCLTLLGWN